MALSGAESSSSPWRISGSCPADWPAKLRRSGGGFFHTPSGLALSAPRGAALFAELVDGETVGVAVGVRARCSLTAEPRHVYLPTLPALANPEQGDAALAALVAVFREQDAAEVVVDAFDASWLPGTLPGAEETRPRNEYVVRLSADPDEMMRGCSRHHQRSIRHGQREGWVLRTPDGDEARVLLRLVQESAADRAAQRRDAFLVEPNPLAAALTDGEHWGSTMFAAWTGPTPLAAALIGWAGRRAFYLRGGSTPEGYRVGAAAWLHWRVMGELGLRGFSEYNLGGAPPGAARAGDPAHGLHRFKREFGAAVRPCQGLRWTLNLAHAYAHGAARWDKGMGKVGE